MIKINQNVVRIKLEQFSLGFSIFFIFFLILSSTSTIKASCASGYSCSPGDPDQQSRPCNPGWQDRLTD